MWDDDADICMMNSDLNKFLSLENEFNANNITFLYFKRFGFYKIYDYNVKN